MFVQLQIYIFCFCFIAELQALVDLLDSSMGDAENATSTKKRAAGRELSRDNPGPDDDEDVSEQETGTFKRASEEVLATRRIVKVRRGSTASAPSSNPFAGIRLVPPTENSGSVAEVQHDTEAADEKAGSDEANGKDIPHEVTQKDGDHSDEPVKCKIDTSEAKSVPKVQPVDQNSTVLSESAISKVDDNLVFESNKIENEEPAGGDKTGNEELVRDAEKESENDECVSCDKNEDEVPARGDKNENEEPSEGNEIQNKETGEQEKTENEENKEDKSEGEPSKEAAPLNSFQQLSSSQNAFTGLAGTGFSTSTFSFGNIPKDGVGLTTSFGLSNNGSSALFGTSGSSTVSKSERSGFPSMQEVAVETGEENEKVVFNADSILFEFIDGSWKERGKGELKVNVPTSGTGRGRILMRARGNYRLILNASLYPDMKLTNMDKRGITFACMNSTIDGKDGLSTFGVKFKDVSIVEEFRAAVTEHKR
ncbi:nuclear pore complex protein NUP50A isoform X1 [Cucumis melo var. makuwa]|uniref:Nuclear pore complex protein NUP50A isoform X1 n=1 Tax=Cucumis melo var. makuwa TaxID=1194695 RepID=A0A5A7UW04_CUCMM|nr:nuclear pore complex protein NUP50A isoform X1 [Cucumis melo var. makuwa]